MKHLKANKKSKSRAQIGKKTIDAHVVESISAFFLQKKKKKLTFNK